MSKSSKQLLNELCQRLQFDKPKYYTSQLPGYPRRHLTTVLVVNNKEYVWSKNKMLNGVASKIKEAEQLICEMVYPKLLKEYKGKLDEIEREQNLPPNWNDNLPRDIKITIVKHDERKKNKKLV